MGLGTSVVGKKKGPTINILRGCRNEAGEEKISSSKHGLATHLEKKKKRVKTVKRGWRNQRWGPFVAEGEGREV